LRLLSIAFSRLRFTTSVYALSWPDNSGASGDLTIFDAEIAAGRSLQQWRLLQSYRRLLRESLQCEACDGDLIGDESYFMARITDPMGMGRSNVVLRR
jgi:hypothetical protein